MKPGPRAERHQRPRWRTTAWALFGWLMLSPSNTAAAGSSIDVNKASREQLEALPGVGEKIASDIVRERAEHGSFLDLADLRSRVPSLSEGILRKATTHLQVGAPPPAQTAPAEKEIVTPDLVSQVLQRFSHEPTVRQVQVQAVDYVGAHPDMVESWRLRARLQALGPRFTATGQGTEDDDLRTVTNLDATAAEIESRTVASQGRIMLQARWDLDRLIFEPQEMAVSREAVRTANLRDRVLEEVTRRYFERRRLQVDLALFPSIDLADRVRKELRLQELTADIDGITGGWFSARLAASAPPEPGPRDE